MKLDDIPSVAKKSVRSALFFTPSLYRSVTSEHRYRVLYRLHRVHEPEFRLVAAFLPEAPMVVDVGGNIGQSVLSIMACMPDARIVTFEPNPGPAATLARVAERFGGQVELQRCGLGAEAVTHTLYVPTYRGKEMTGLASFDEAEARDWLSPDTVYFFDPDRLSMQAIPVETRRLDEFGYDPHLIKIDVQGFEYEVLQGAIETLDRAQPIVIAEAPDDRLVELMAAHGYRVTEFNGNALRPSRRTQSNQVFLPARLSIG